MTRRRKQRRDQPPLPIRQITWIARTIPTMLDLSGIVPRHPILHLLDKDGESQNADIARLPFGQALSRNSRIVGEVDEGRGEEIVARQDSAGFEILHKDFEEAGLVKARRRSSTVPSKHQNA